jgi:hypothetical protein
VVTHKVFQQHLFKNFDPDDDFIIVTISLAVDHFAK